MSMLKRNILTAIVLFFVACLFVSVFYVGTKANKRYEARIQERIINPGVQSIKGMEVETICIMRDQLAVQYEGDVMTITALLCTGELVQWQLPRPRRGDPV